MKVYAACETSSLRTTFIYVTPILNPFPHFVLLAAKVHRTICFPLTTSGNGLTFDLKVSKEGTFALAKVKLFYSQLYCFVLELYVEIFLVTVV